MLPHDNYIMHFNKNHDPKTGKFAKGPSGSVLKSNAKNQNVKNKTFNKPTESMDISEMSDDELRKRINRLRMEDEYKRLTKSDLNKKGSNYLRNLPSRIFDKTVFTLLGAVLGATGKKITKIL